MLYVDTILVPGQHRVNDGYSEESWRGELDVGRSDLMGRVKPGLAEL